jgi:HK97 gp10 family phage protein
MVKIETEGFDDFENLLIQISDEFGYRESTRNVLTPALKVALDPVYNSAKNNARVNTGRMRDGIKLESRIPTNGDKQSNYVFEGDAAIGIVSARKSKISLSEEFGTQEKAGKPFLRPAIENNQEIILRRLSSYLAFKLQSYRAKKIKGKKS